MVAFPGFGLFYVLLLSLNKFLIGINLRYAHQMPLIIGGVSVVYRGSRLGKNYNKCATCHKRKKQVSIICIEKNVTKATVILCPVFSGGEFDICF